ncbi:uncharacterized protein LOC116339709 [Contarinia nasturtii]|uniref:uncharacterized protein LOC116339709 n=1 Tax=Contarinia nasturtii TaxID=265458 RepID=UPI0012D38F64|nr:uncharacterized protein LOC116339709 [Contarinia nasturtii]
MNFFKFAFFFVVLFMILNFELADAGNSGSKVKKGDVSKKGKNVVGEKLGKLAKGAKEALISCVTEEVSDDEEYPAKRNPKSILPPLPYPAEEILKKGKEQRSRAKFIAELNSR